MAQGVGDAQLLLDREPLCLEMLHLCISALGEVDGIRWMKLCCGNHPAQSGPASAGYSPLRGVRQGQGQTPESRARTLASLIRSSSASAY